MSEDEGNRMIYEARLKAQRDEYSRIQGAHQQGLEQGLEQGRREGWEKGREEIILHMATHGMGVKDIAAITQVSEQAVGSILKQGLDEAKSLFT
jgi:predicted transposase/invertase (TIGR01784 family)